ncbi:hypothetical protein V502_09139 [Pseudogymnoascus sp. VKM F-4520 (FW-2644)]|nr:hypothetical protein V502_09139 [Pseudogymnoascus sp. VKM F-4520 (FW-2644)]
MAANLKAYPPGIHAPSVTFFLQGEQQEIDWETQEKHLAYLVKAGVHGIVVAGSSGESCALTLAEKGELVKRTREVAKANGNPNLPITVGCLGGSTNSILEQTVTGHKNGADFALVLVPSTFHWSMTKKAIVDFFQDVGDRSPLPIIIYNFPNLLSGLDVDSDMMETLSAHPNICGVKLTCGNISKMTRVAALHSPSQFAAVSGQSDLIVSALAGGGVGTISGVVNLFPKVLIEIYNLYNAGKLSEAIALQKKVSGPEHGIGTSDVSGMKWIIAQERGYPESSRDCRRPFPKFDDPAKKERVQKYVAPLLAVEEELYSKK